MSKLKKGMAFWLHKSVEKSKGRKERFIIKKITDTRVTVYWNDEDGEGEVGYTIQQALKSFEDHDWILHENQ